MTSIWKYIATSAVSMLLMLSLAYLSLNAQAVTKAEMHEAIASDHDLLKETRDDVKELRKQVETLTREVGELKGILRNR
jgi:hypothetical protein